MPGPGGMRRAHGFTLIELIAVMAIIALLLTLALPRYFGAVDAGRVTVQRQNIATLHDAIDKFYADQARYPASLEEMVEKRYLREVPIDPVSEQRDWIIVGPADPTLGAVHKVRPPQQAASSPLGL